MSGGLRPPILKVSFQNPLSFTLLLSEDLDMDHVIKICGEEEWSEKGKRLTQVHVHLQDGR